MTSTYEKIATTTLGSSSTSITFSSIPATYTDLVLVSSRKLDQNGGYYAAVRFNSDTGSNYSNTQVYGSGSSAASSRNSNETFGRTGFPSNEWGVTVTNIQNYSNTTTYKTSISRDNSPNEFVYGVAMLWRSTAAINAINIICQSGSNFLTGSMFTLYGIKAE
jgi:hypothetical protein